MPRGRPRNTEPETEKANSRAFEAPLWAAADKLRGNMDAAEYKHVALGLIFLKYISDRFNERRNEIASDQTIPDVLRDELLEEKDSYTAESVFWVPEHARWEYLKENATHFGFVIDKCCSQLVLLRPRTWRVPRAYLSISQICL